MSLRPSVAPAIAASLVLTAAVATCAQPHPDVKEIVQKAVAANQAVFKAAPEFNYKERDRTSKGSKTYQVTMIEGSPYQRLIAVNDKPLSPSRAAEEQKKQEQVEAQRRSESSDARRNRIQKFEKERQRDNAMMEQLTRAFEFTFAGQHKARGFNVYVLKATPRPGYNPPNMETQVLTGMQGELWVDQKTYNWVKVTAHVIHPVSIEGFLAEVEPGTQFELEESPVAGGMWQVTHFAMKSNAKILHLFTHDSEADETYFDHKRIADPGRK